MMTEDMLAATGRHLDEVDLQFVRELIDPSNYTTRVNPKLFLYDIVANARNSLDVDKVRVNSLPLLAQPSVGEALSLLCPCQSVGLCGVVVVAGSVRLSGSRQPPAWHSNSAPSREAGEELPSGHHIALLDDALVAFVAWFSSRSLFHCMHGAPCVRQIDNEICFNSKEIFNIYESAHAGRPCPVASASRRLSFSRRARRAFSMSANVRVCVWRLFRLFHTRYSLHKQVYSHRVSKAVEYMLCDVLLLADPVLHLSEAILSASAYCRLTDCVLKQIECSTEPELQAARDLIHRIRTRRLYRLVEEAIIPTQLADMPDVTAADILSCAPPTAAAIAASDVQVQNLRISYAMKDNNPVDHVRFFDKSAVDVSYRIPKSKVSHVMPDHFSERILRVYIKDLEEQQPTKPKFEALKAATTEWLKQHRVLSPVIKRTASGALSRKPSFLHRSPLRHDSQNSGHSAAAAAADGGSIVEEHEEAADKQVQLPEHSNNDPSLINNGRRQQNNQPIGGNEQQQPQQPQQQQQEQQVGSVAMAVSSPFLSSVSSLKRKRASSIGRDADSSSGESSPVAPVSSRRHSVAPYDSPSAATRRSSMDPPSPQLLHTAHASYHVNPTLACHFPVSASPLQQTALMGSPTPPTRSQSPLPSNRRTVNTTAGISGNDSNNTTNSNSSSSTGTEVKRSRPGSRTGSSSTQADGYSCGGGADGLTSPHSPRPSSPYPSPLRAHTSTPPPLVSRNAHSAHT